MRPQPLIRAYLIDLDGTLIRGGAALPGAAALLRELGNQFVLVSNNAEHTPAELAAELSDLGLDAPAERILLAGTTALDDVATRLPGARVLLLGSSSLRAYARDLGLVCASANPDIVLLARDRCFSYAALSAAANALRAGAELVVANPDLAHPGPDGAIVPETGALLAALLACAGRVPYRVVGKPEPTLFRTALALLGARPGEAVMIGDNPSTDGVGARRMGIGYVQIEDGRLPNPSEWRRLCEIALIEPSCAPALAC